MSTEVDQLLRDTLHGRAATDSPPVPDRMPSGGRRTPWLLVAATAITVIAVGGGIAHLTKRPTQHAGWR